MYSKLWARYATTTTVKDLFEKVAGHGDRVQVLTWRLKSLPGQGPKTSSFCRLISAARSPPSMSLTSPSCRCDSYGFTYPACLDDRNKAVRSLAPVCALGLPGPSSSYCGAACTGLRRPAAASALSLRPSGPHVALSSAWYRSGAEIEDDGEEPEEGVPEESGRWPWGAGVPLVRYRCTPEVMRTRERKRTRGWGRAAGGGSDELRSLGSVAGARLPSTCISAPSARMMTEDGVWERGEGSSSMRWSALPGTMHGLGEGEWSSKGGLWS